MINNSDRLHSILNDIEDYGILLLDPFGNILNWNKGGQKVKGYKADEVIGQNINLFYTKEDLEKKLPQKLLADAKLHGKACDEGWRVRKDGSLFLCKFVVSALYDEKQKLTGFSGLAHDLTEKINLKEAGKSLQQTKEGLATIFNASPSAMMIAGSQEGECIEINESFIKIFGYSREEAIGCTADKIGIVSKETLDRDLGRLKQQGYFKNEEFILRAKDGKRIHAIVSAELFKMNEKDCVLAVFHDITEMKEMEQKIAENERKWRKIIEDAGDVLYTADASGIFLYINQRVTMLTGYSSEELLGKHFSLLIAPEWLERVKSHYQAQFKSKIHETVMEFMILLKDGQRKWVEQVGIMQVEKGWIEGFQCIVRDINERKKTNLLLEDQKHIIEQKNKDMLDSINYAKYIQDAIFPPEELIKKILPHSFVLLKPKNIVSGDFYWMEKFENKIFIAAVDCTGHGVPGALLSIVGYNLLSKSVNEHAHTKPNKILNDLSSEINKTLRQTIKNSVVKDTMDIGLCSIDTEKNVLEYAGAFIPLYIIRNNNLIIIPADRFPIGVFSADKSLDFVNHEIPLEKGDTIYLFSDGYPDQFGGPSGKKLKYKAFKDILLSMQHLSMTEQKSMLEKTMEEWKVSGEQTDDILVIGVKYEGII